MAKKIVKVRKIRFFRLFLLLLTLAAIVFFAYIALKIHTKNIIIKGNTYLNDEDIIKMANLEDYPPFLFINSWKIERVLKNNKYIKTAEVNKNFFYTITITIKEHDVLFKNSNNKYVLENSSEITSNKNIRVPRLVNYTPEDKYKKLITNMSEIDKGVLGKISEISYDPNDFDKDRFLLLMDDGNSVFLTLTKFEMINYYDDVLGQLEGRKGILYLDSGNHFKIME